MKGDLLKCDRPPHVLHVLEATAGGTMRYMENIAEATQDTDLVCAFAYGISRADSHLAPFLKHVEQLGWLTYPIDMRRDINPRQDLSALLQLRAVIRGFRPDVLHCHSSKGGALGRAACFASGSSPARLYSPHALAAPLGERYLYIERLLARCTERFVAVSKSEREQIIDFDLATRDEVSVVYPSVNCDHFVPMSREEARRAVHLGSNPLVVSIGRLAPQKDPFAFIEIVRLLRNRIPTVQALWVGSGREENEKEFHDACVEAGLQDTIQVASWTDDVRRYIAAADVLLSTSRFESFGYVTAEALAMEVPVVASDVTGSCDIMVGELRRWMYPPGNCSAAVDRLVQLLENRALGQEVGKVGREMVNTRFSRKSMREALLDAYTLAQQDSRVGTPVSTGSLASNLGHTFGAPRVSSISGACRSGEPAAARPETLV